MLPATPERTADEERKAGLQPCCECRLHAYAESDLQHVKTVSKLRGPDTDSTAKWSKKIRPCTSLHVGGVEVEARDIAKRKQFRYATYPNRTSDLRITSATPYHLAKEAMLD